MSRPIVIGVVLLTALIVSACDNAAPKKQQSKLAIPKGESPLDSVIKKMQEKPSPPPNPAHLTVAPPMVDFGEIKVGEGVTRTVRLTNSGSVALSLQQLHVAGQGPAFRLGGACQRGVELAGGASCDLDIVYNPTREGYADAELVIGNSAEDGPVFVALTAQSRSPVPAPMPVVVMPAPVAHTPKADASLNFARTRHDRGLAIDVVATSDEPERRMSDRDYTDAGLPGIVSTFPVDRSRVVTADRYIPAVLEDTLNSQLGGRVIAVIDRHVYGSDGRKVLIPAGSRVIGRYESSIKVGQARIDIAWSRILRPDGVSINIDDNTADVMGRAGVPGDLDTRFFEKYGVSLLSSAITAAATATLGDGTTNVVNSTTGGVTQVESNRTLALQQFGRDTSDLSKRILDENVDVRPVLVVPQGTRLNIIPREDIWLRDPDHIVAATPPKGTKELARIAAKVPGDLSAYLPALAELVAQNPTLRSIAPQTMQQIYQSQVLQQLKDQLGNTSQTQIPSQPTQPQAKP